LAQPVAVPSGTVRLANARKLYLARTYMYVAAKADGLVIVDVTRPAAPVVWPGLTRSEEHTSELQSLMRISYAVFCLKKKKYTTKQSHRDIHRRQTEQKQ